MVLLPVGVDHVLEEHVGKFSGGVSESLSHLLAIESGKIKRIFLTLFFPLEINCTEIHIIFCH